MKTILLLAMASLTMVASGALAQQDACSNQYNGCMDRCGSRPQSVQATCMQTCESTSNQCYEGMYGRPPASGAVSAPSVQSQPEERDSSDAQGSARGQ